MRRALAILVVFLFSAPPALAARRRAITPPAPLAIPGIEKIAADALAAGVPGLTIAVRKGNAYYTRAWGDADVAKQLPARTDAVWQVGSVTKQFTAAAILRLAEAGKLRLEDRARAWLPELDERFEGITLHHLLTHTSGVVDYVGQLTSLYQAKSPAEVLALIAAKPPTFTPGAHFSYSNSGYFLLGVIIERASATTYEQYLRDTFFVPLQLSETSYCGSGAPAPDGYAQDPADHAVFPIPAMDMSLVWAAGAVCSTGMDLLRWSSALSSGRAVSLQSYALMTSGVEPTDMRAPGYGFALILDQFDGRRRVWHNGQIPGFQSHLAWYPDEELSIAVLANLYANKDQATAVANEIARAMKP